MSHQFPKYCVDPKKIALMGDQNGWLVENDINVYRHKCSVGCKVGKGAASQVIHRRAL